MIYLWKSPLKYEICTDEDDLSKYIGIYNRDKGPDNALVNNGYMDSSQWDWSKNYLEFSFRVSAIELLKI